MKRKFLSSILVIGMFAGTVTCYASSTNYNAQFVDSNEFTQVATATKTSTTDNCSVLVETMYKSNNGVKGEVATGYNKLRVRIGKTGAQSSEQTVTKGTTVDFTLSSNYKAKGTTLYMYAMGNDPSLDCYIDGTFNAN